MLLNDVAMEIVIYRVGKHPVQAFTYEEQPVDQVSTRAWYHALKRAGIEKFRFYDLRHTWASRHVQNGTPIFALQELGGWMKEKMMRRYAHLAADHLAGCVGNVNIHGTFLAHLPLAPKRSDENFQ